jgi:flagellar protein FlaG
MRKGRKAVRMSSEIQSKLSPQALPRVEIQLPASAKAVGQTAVVTAVEPGNKEHVQPIPKVEVQYDAEKSKKNLEEAIQKLNDMLKDSGRTLSFSMDVKLGRPIVFVKNMSNGEVIRQIPSEVVVNVAHGIEDFKGMLHNAIS